MSSNKKVIVLNVNNQEYEVLDFTRGAERDCWTNRNKVRV